MTGSRPVLAMTARKPVKGIVIHVLSEMPLLTARRLMHRVQKHGVSVSYAAVWKALQELVELGVVSKVQRAYQLNPIWIAQLKQFAARVEQASKEVAVLHCFRCPSLDRKGNGTFKIMEVLV